MCPLENGTARAAARDLGTGWKVNPYFIIPPGETFEIAHENHPEAKPLFHSDRGYQYTSKSFRKKLNKAGMTQSMSRVSRCIDNGPMEAFWEMLKSEMYYLKKFQTYEELKEAISDYIDYYNNHRYQKRLNCMTPIEYRNYLKDAA